MGGVQLIPYCVTFRLLQMASSESVRGSKRHNRRRRPPIANTKPLGATWQEYAFVPRKRGSKRAGGAGCMLACKLQL